MTNQTKQAQAYEDAKTMLIDLVSRNQFDAGTLQAMLDVTLHGKDSPLASLSPQPEAGSPVEGLSNETLSEELLAAREMFGPIYAKGVDLLAEVAARLGKPAHSVSREAIAAKLKEISQQASEQGYPFKGDWFSWYAQRLFTLQLPAPHPEKLMVDLSELQRWSLSEGQMFRERSNGGLFGKGEHRFEFGTSFVKVADILATLRAHGIEIKGVE